MNSPPTVNSCRGRGSARAWARALELTTPIAHRPDRVFPGVIQELGARLGGAPALLSDAECLTYRALAGRANQYARWAIEQGLKKGDAVALLMPNRPEYMAAWLGITSVGGVVALLNTQLAGPPLAHSIQLAAPRHIIVAPEHSQTLAAIVPLFTQPPVIWCSGPSDSYRNLEHEVARYSDDDLGGSERRLLTIEDRALLVYTSGTTGLPKAALVTHGRLMQTSHWFAGIMDIQPADRMYNCLPMYHSVGGLQVPGAILAGGGSVVIARRFSAAGFWADASRWDCTLFQYIGELCRYLLRADPSPRDREHRIRMACGNGLSAEIWEPFQNRFRIPRILEFYGSTEGNVSLFNVEGEPGAIGRMPSYLAHRFPTALIRVDSETNEPLRDERGLCIRCAPDETGEAVGRMLKDSLNVGSRFDGYTSREASEKKILRDVFGPGDAWFRTGDLMRRDERGYFYFVDRMGDTFRWKGENVSTLEVAEAISAFPGVAHASVYGVRVPGADGRAGMAALVPDGTLDLASFRRHLVVSLPGYARPLFLRIRKEMEMTATFKYSKSELVRAGYDPLATDDAIYFDDPVRRCFVRVDQAVFDRIQQGDASSASQGVDEGEGRTDAA